MSDNKKLKTMNKTLDSISIVSDESRKFSVKIGNYYAEILQQIKKEADHKHWTTGTVLYEICMMMDPELECMDSGTLVEQIVNEQLSREGVDVEAIDTLGVDPDVVECEVRKRVVVYMPESVYEQLPYFKGSYFEEMIQAYLETPFSTRNERAVIKRDIHSAIRNSGSRTEVSAKLEKLLKEYNDLSHLVDSATVWYVGLEVDELEDRLDDETKETVGSRVPPLEYLFSKKLEIVEEVAEGVPTTAISDQIDKDMMVGNEVEYIESIFGCSRKTAQNYWNQVNDFWNDDEWRREFVCNWEDEVLLDLVKNMVAFEYDNKSADQSNPAHVLAVSQLKNRGEFETVLEGQNYTLNLTDLGDGEYSFKLSSK